MLDTVSLAILPSLSPARYAPHPLHRDARDWPETNCYVDVWIEVLHALGEDPTTALGFTAALDFEGDHFTFAKVPADDLREQFGLEVRELAIYDCLEAHLVEQTRRGRMVLVEVDGFNLPDTRGMSYRREHVKTTIAVNRIDPARGALHYFHGAGFFALDGEDYHGLMRLGARWDGDLWPYAEMVKLDRRRRADDGVALAILRRHVGRRPHGNPVAAFRDRVREQAAAVRPGGLHAYAFNTARQLGMTFELLGRHLRWLEGRGLSARPLGPTVDSCEALSSGAKAFQFLLARALARHRFEGLEPALDPLADHYDRVMDGVAAL